MSYRPPSKTPKTDWARFIDRRKRELDWSATRAFEEVRAGLRLADKSRSAYLAYEYDREPKAAAAAVFRDVFGGEPTDADRAPVVASVTPAIDQSAVVDAIKEQTNALIRQAKAQEAQTSVMREFVTEMRKLAHGQIRLAQLVGEAVGLPPGSPLLEAVPFGTPDRPRSHEGRSGPPASAGTK